MQSLPKTEGDCSTLSDLSVKTESDWKNTQIKPDSPTPSEMSPIRPESPDSENCTDQSEQMENVELQTDGDIEHDIDFTLLDASLISSLTRKPDNKKLKGKGKTKGTTKIKN